MQIKKLHGIIINSRPYGDLDRVVSIFSYEYGLIRIVAKGVRKITSRRGCHLDVLNYVRMEIEEPSKGGVHYLREVSTLMNFPSLKKNPDGFASGCLIASFLSRIIPGISPQKTLFTLTKKTFEALNSIGDPKLILFKYFLKTTRLLGHLPKVLPSKNLRKELTSALYTLDPHFALNARRTLGIFSN